MEKDTIRFPQPAPAKNLTIGKSNNEFSLELTFWRDDRCVVLTAERLHMDRLGQSPALQSKHRIYRSQA